MWVVLLAIATVGALAYAATRIAADAVETQARDRVSASAEVSGRYVEEQLTGFATVTNSYATRPSLVRAMQGSAAGPDVRAVNQHLEQMVETGGYRLASVLDAQGKAIAVYPYDPLPIGKNFSHRDYFVGVNRTGTPYVSEVFNAAVAGEPRLVATAAIIRDDADGDQPGKVLGVLAGTVRTTAIQNFTEQFAKSQNVTIAVTDQRGVLVAAEHGIPESLKPEDDARVREALAGRSGTKRLGEGEDEVLTSYTRVPKIGWTISASVPTKTALAEVHRLQVLVWAVAGFLSALLGAVLWWLVHSLSNSERRLQHKVRELETANRTLDTFSHTLVHDLRNPLTVIGGFAHTLRSVLTDADDRVREMTSHIETSAERMQQLIEDVLALATVSRALERQPCDPAAVLQEAVAAVQGVDVQVGWMPETIEANRATLYRCFQNLLANAARYASGPDGRAEVRVWADEHPWAWRFCVEDHGPGISAENRARMFQAFERGQEQPNQSGTGLGLSIVFAGAQAHGGSASVEEAPGGGARFIFEIGKPAVGADREASTHMPPAQTP
jgi:signal transduction histidine kinase